MMPAYTFGSRQNEGWALRLGLEAVSIPSGRAVKLGPKSSRWRIERVETIAVSPALSRELTEAAIAKTGGKFVLLRAEKVETGKYLVRVNTEGLRKLGRTAASVYRGSPALITEGWMEIGSQNVSHHRDQLWVVSVDDVLRVGQEYRETAPDRVIYVEDGALKLDSFHAWRVRDARANPAEYIKDGWCPVDQLPNEWIGRVVEFFDEARETIGSGHPYGLTKVGPEPEVNYEWNALKPSGMNPHMSVRPEAVWAKLREDLVWDQTPKAKILEERDEVVFSDPPYHDGMQVVAKITTGEDGRRRYVVPNTPGEKFHLTKYEQGGRIEESRESLGKVLADYTDLGPRAGKIEIPEGLKRPLDGQYVVEFVNPRKSHWYLKVIREAVETGEPTVDVSIYLGKSVSRDPSHVWVITKDGKILTEKVGEGTAVFTAIPESALILRYQWSNYGNTYAELHEVFYRPQNLTEAQLATVEEMQWGGEVKYFAMNGGWDKDLRVGVIKFSTPYEGKGFPAERKALLGGMTAAFPVDVMEYRQVNVTPKPDPFNQDHPVLSWIEVGPEKK